MRFINVRELHNKTARVLGVVMKGDRIVVTYRGKPCAAIIPLFEDDLEAFILDTQPSPRKPAAKPSEDAPGASRGAGQG